MTLGRLRLSVAEARDLAEGALRGIGYHNDEARIIADHVIDAAMCGYEYSGLAKILNVVESEHFWSPRRSMKAFARDRPGALLTPALPFAAPSSEVSLVRIWGLGARRVGKFTVVVSILPQSRADDGADCDGQTSLLVGSRSGAESRWIEQAHG